MKYAIFDGRYWWKEDVMDSFITLCSTLKEAKREARDHGGDNVIVKMEDVDGTLVAIEEITKKPKLDKETEETCAFLYK